MPKFAFFGGPRMGEILEVEDQPLHEFPRPADRDMAELASARVPRDMVEITRDIYEGRLAVFAPGGQRVRFFEHQRIGRERNAIEADGQRIKDIRQAMAKVAYMRNAPRRLNFEKEISDSMAVVEQKLTGLEHEVDARQGRFEAEEKDRLQRVRQAASF